MTKPSLPFVDLSINTDLVRRILVDFIRTETGPADALQDLFSGISETRPVGH